MNRTAIVSSVFAAAWALPVLAALQAHQAQPPSSPAYRTWPAYGGGPEQIRYSRLDQINRKNVTQLKQAWTIGTISGRG